MKANKNNQFDINKVISDITSAVVGYFSLATLLKQVVEVTTDTLNAEVCSIFLEDKEKEPGILRMMAGSGFSKALVGKAQYKVGEGFTGSVAKTCLKFNIKNRKELEELEIHGRKVWKGKFDVLQWPSHESEFRNCIALPIKIKDQIIGVIKVENKLSSYGDYFTEQDEVYIETIANVVALAIENARLHRLIENQLKIISAKAAHRIYNQIANYDAIEILLKQQATSEVINREEINQIIKRLIDTTKSLKNMVGEFQSYSKPMVIEKRLTNLNKIIKDEVWLAKPTNGITIKIHLDNNIPNLMIDGARFAEAIKELIQNASRAVSRRISKSQEGLIKILTKYIPKENDDKKSRNDSGYILIDVVDNGPGFPDNFPIFKPFQTTDPRGTGLGLVTVKELIEAHDGKIELLNKPGKGAHFKIMIPVSSRSLNE